MESTAATCARETSTIVGEGVQNGGDIIFANLHSFLSERTHQ